MSDYRLNKIKDIITDNTLCIVIPASIIRKIKTCPKDKVTFSKNMKSTGMSSEFMFALEKGMDEYNEALKKLVKR